MYDILYLPLAEADLIGILSYISDHLKAPKAAMNLLDKLDTSILSLKEFPYAYPLFRPINPLHKEFRILTVNNYAVFYTVREPEHKVEIYRVIYAGRDLSYLLP